MARSITAAEFQQDFARQLRLRGWEVELEVGQVYEDGTGSTKNGRIDVVARRERQNRFGPTGPEAERGHRARATSEPHAVPA